MVLLTILRLNEDGSLDNTFSPGSGIGKEQAYYSVSTLKVQEEGLKVSKSKLARPRR